MQQVYQAQDIIEAGIVKGMLEHHGIDCHVAGFYLQGGIGEIPVSGNNAVWVQDSDLEKARTVIEQYRNS